MKPACDLSNTVTVSQVPQRKALEERLTSAKSSHCGLPHQECPASSDAAAECALTRCISVTHLSDHGSHLCQRVVRLLRHNLRIKRGAWDDETSANSAARPTFASRSRNAFAFGMRASVQRTKRKKKSATLASKRSKQRCKPLSKLQIVTKNQSRS